MGNYFYNDKIMTNKKLYNNIKIFINSGYESKDRIKNALSQVSNIDLFDETFDKLVIDEYNNNSKNEFILCEFMNKKLKMYMGNNIIPLNKIKIKNCEDYYEQSIYEILLEKKNKNDKEKELLLNLMLKHKIYDEIYYRLYDNKRINKYKIKYRILKEEKKYDKIFDSLFDEIFNEI